MMAMNPLERWGTRLDFAVRQSGRVAWYAGHGLLVRRMTRRIAAQSPEPKRPMARPTRPVPTMRRLLADVAALLADDLANTERGTYPLPRDEEEALPRMLARSRAFLRDVPEVVRRKNSDQGREIAALAHAAARPDYYLQNFHFQSGGWMTDESARLYDMQVEVLFSGAANAMRRQALVPMADEIGGRDQRLLSYADIACGPGTFLNQARRAFPRLPAFALDLSEPYVREAERRIGRRRRMQPIVAKAESLPFADASLDLATCIYLFHELPPEIRLAVAGQMARVVKPGGLLVVVDSLQTADEPDYDGLLELFPELFHEPYFGGYLDDKLEVLFEKAGFAVERQSNAFLSKVLALRKR